MQSHDTDANLLNPSRDTQPLLNYTPDHTPNQTPNRVSGEDNLEEPIVSQALTNRASRREGDQKLKPDDFVQSAKFGEVYRDDTDSDDDNGKKSRTDSQVEKRQSMVAKVEKLGPVATAFTVFKSYVATGVLYMPN